MEYSSIIGLALIINLQNANLQNANLQNAESRSALPDAPVVDDGRAHRIERFPQTRARLATALHRAAWALEPKTFAVALEGVAFEGVALEGRTLSPRKPTLFHDC